MMHPRYTPAECLLCSCKSAGSSAGGGYTGGIDHVALCSGSNTDFSINADIIRLTPSSSDTLGT